MINSAFECNSNMSTFIWAFLLNCLANCTMADEKMRSPISEGSTRFSVQQFETAWDSFQPTDFGASSDS